MRTCDRVPSLAQTKAQVLSTREGVFLGKVIYFIYMKKIIWLIILLIIVGGGYWYLNNNKLPIEPQINNESTIFSGEVTNIDGYDIDDGIEYSFEYASGLSVEEYNFGARINKFREGREIRPMDCGGFFAEDDELKMQFSFAKVGSEGVTQRYEKGDVLIDEDGILAKGKRDISGICENSDELIIKKDDIFIIFSVAPSTTKLVDEYKQIIKTFTILEA